MSAFAELFKHFQVIQCGIYPTTYEMILNIVQLKTRQQIGDD